MLDTNQCIGLSYYDGLDATGHGLNATGTSTTDKTASHWFTARYDGNGLANANGQIGFDDGVVCKSLTLKPDDDIRLALDARLIDESIYGIGRHASNDSE